MSTINSKLFCSYKELYTLTLDIFIYFINSQFILKFMFHRALNICANLNIINVHVGISVCECT